MKNYFWTTIFCISFFNSIFASEVECQGEVSVDSENAIEMITLSDQNCENCHPPIVKYDQSCESLIQNPSLLKFESSFSSTGPNQVQYQITFNRPATEIADLISTVDKLRNSYNYNLTMSGNQEDSYFVINIKISRKKLGLFSGLITDFVNIPAGSFSMGSPATEVGPYESEISHQVTPAKSFDLQTTEVTQAQWFGVMGYNDSYYSKSNYCDDFQEINGVGLCPSNPVDSVSWFDIKKFIKKLNASQTIYTYRLPTEAEWEYAARGGSSAAYSFGDDASKLGDFAWYGANSRVDGYNQTHEVAQKEKNQYKLYDMHGNVWEWVQDPVPAPWSNTPFPFQVLRGGGFLDEAKNLPSDFRRSEDTLYRYRDFGFRLVRTPR